MRGLERCHGEVILNREVEALVLHPAQVERLPFDGSLHHGGQLAEYAELEGGVERFVAEHGVGGERDVVVAAVNGAAYALGEVHARLAAPQLAFVGDVVVNEGRALEVLDRRRGASGASGITAHGACREHADERAVPLAAVCGKGGERCVQVALKVRMLGLFRKERIQIRVQIMVVLGEVYGEGVGHSASFHSWCKMGRGCFDSLSQNNPVPK